MRARPFLLKFPYRLIRPVAVVTLACFVYSSIFAQGVAALVEPPAAAPDAFAADDLVVPAAWGRVADARYFGSKTVVIALQDLHCHAEVQKNISQVLSLLDRKFGLRNVYVEGACGAMDTSWLTAIQDRTLRAKVLDGMIGRGVLTGAEYYAAAAQRPDLLVGIEDRSLYTANLERLGRIVHERANIEAALSSVESRINGLKDAYYNPQQKKLERLAGNYAAGGIVPRKYYASLERYCGRLGIDISEYENIAGYLTLAEMEKKLDCKAAARQLQAVVVLLKQRLPYHSYRQLFDRTREFRDTDLLCLYLAAAAPACGLQETIKTDYPELDRYIAYLNANRAIDPLSLVAEERKLVREINRLLAENGSQREIAFLADYFKCSRDYYTNRISPEEYGYFNANAERFHQLWRKYADEWGFRTLTPYAELMATFYRVNIERNNCFIRTIVGDGAAAGNETAQSGDDATRIAYSLKDADLRVVVTGGFHTPGLAQLLGERKISYLVITPNVTQDTKIADATYEQLAGEQALILSQALALLALSQNPRSTQAKVIAETLMLTLHGKEDIARVRTEINEAIGEALAKKGEQERTVTFGMEEGRDGTYRFWVTDDDAGRGKQATSYFIYDPHVKDIARKIRPDGRTETAAAKNMSAANRTAMAFSAGVTAALGALSLSMNWIIGCGVGIVAGGFYLVQRQYIVKAQASQRTDMENAGDRLETVLSGLPQTLAASLISAGCRVDPSPEKYVPARYRDGRIDVNLGLIERLQEQAPRMAVLVLRHELRHAGFGRRLPFITKHAGWLEEFIVSLGDFSDLVCMTLFPEGWMPLTKVRQGNRAVKNKERADTTAVLWPSLWETVVFPFAGSQFIGLWWATLGFSFAHTVAQWFARAKHPGGHAAMPFRRIVRNFAVHLALSGAFVLPYLVMDPLSATVVSASIHALYNHFIRGGMLPQWMPAASIFGEDYEVLPWDFDLIAAEQAELLGLSVDQWKDLFYYIPVGEFSPQKKDIMTDQARFLVDLLFKDADEEDRVALASSLVENTDPMTTMKFILKGPKEQKYQRLLFAIGIPYALATIYSTYMNFFSFIPVSSVSVAAAYLSLAVTAYYSLFCNYMGLAGVARKDNKIFVVPGASGSAITDTSTHEFLHSLAFRGLVKADLPMASAFGKLAAFRDGGKRSGWFRQGEKLFNSYPDPEKRFEAMADLGFMKKKIAHWREMFTNVSSMKKEPVWTYKAGTVLAGMAQALSEKTGRPDDAWEYLRLVALGGDPLRAEIMVTMRRYYPEALLAAAFPPEADIAKMRALKYRQPDINFAYTRPGPRVSQALLPKIPVIREIAEIFGGREQPADLRGPVRMSEIYLASLGNIPVSDATHHQYAYQWISKKVDSGEWPSDCVLLNFDFAPDDEDGRSGVDSHNWAGTLKNEGKIGQYWWVSSDPAASTRVSHHTDLRLGDFRQLPATNKPVILSIDLSYFLSSSLPEDLLDTEKVQQRVSDLVAFITSRGYNIAGINIARSPESMDVSHFQKESVVIRLCGRLGFELGKIMINERTDHILYSKDDYVSFEYEDQRITGISASTAGGLLRALEEQDPFIKVAACRELGRSGDQAAVDALERMIVRENAATHKKRFVIEAAYAALKDIGRPIADVSPAPGQDIEGLLRRLGSDDGADGYTLFAKPLSLWAKEHRLFLEFHPELIYDTEGQKHLRQIVEEAQTWDLVGIREFVMEYAAGIGEGEKTQQWITNLTAYVQKNNPGMPQQKLAALQRDYLVGRKGPHAVKKTDSPLVWAARGTAFAHIRQEREGKLFGVVDMTGMTLADLPLWPVNEQGELREDLVSWMNVRNAVPPSAYYRAPKCSLRQIISAVRKTGETTMAQDSLFGEVDGKQELALIEHHLNAIFNNEEEFGSDEKIDFGQEIADISRYARGSARTAMDTLIFRVLEEHLFTGKRLPTEQEIRDREFVVLRPFTVDGLKRFLDSFYESTVSVFRSPSKKKTLVVVSREMPEAAQTVFGNFAKVFGHAHPRNEDPQPSSKDRISIDHMVNDGDDINETELILSLVNGKLQLFLAEKGREEYFVGDEQAIPELVRLGVLKPQKDTRNISFANRLGMAALAGAASALAGLFVFSNPLGWLLGAPFFALYAVQGWYIAKAEWVISPPMPFVKRLRYMMKLAVPARVLGGNVYYDDELMAALPRWLQEMVRAHEERHLAFFGKSLLFALMPFLEEAVVSLGDMAQLAGSVRSAIVKSIASARGATASAGVTPAMNASLESVESREARWMRTHASDMTGKAMVAVAADIDTDKLLRLNGLGMKAFGITSSRQPGGILMGNVLVPLAGSEEPVSMQVRAQVEGYGGETVVVLNLATGDREASGENKQEQRLVDMQLLGRGALAVLERIREDDVWKTRLAAFGLHLGPRFTPDIVELSGIETVAAHPVAMEDAYSDSLRQAMFVYNASAGGMRDVFPEKAFRDLGIGREYLDRICTAGQADANKLGLILCDRVVGAEALKKQYPWLVNLRYERNYFPVDAEERAKAYITGIYAPGVVNKQVDPWSDSPGRLGERVLVSALAGHDRRVGKFTDVEGYVKNMLVPAGVGLVQLVGLRKPFATTLFEGDDILIDWSKVDGVEEMIAAGELSAAEVNGASAGSNDYVNREDATLSGARIAGKVYARMKADGRLDDFYPFVRKNSDWLGTKDTIYAFTQWVFGRQLAETVRTLSAGREKVLFSMDVNGERPRDVLAALNYWFGFGFDGVQLSVGDSSMLSEEFIRELTRVAVKANPDPIISIKVPADTPLPVFDRIRKGGCVAVRDMSGLGPEERLAASDGVEIDSLARAPRDVNGAEDYYIRTVRSAMLSGASFVFFRMGMLWGEEVDIDNAHVRSMYRMPAAGGSRHRFDRGFLARLGQLRIRGREDYAEAYARGLQLPVAGRLGREWFSGMDWHTTITLHYSFSNGMVKQVAGQGLHCLLKAYEIMDADAKNNVTADEFYSAVFFFNKAYQLLALPGIAENDRRALVAGVQRLQKDALSTDDIEYRRACNVRLFGYIRGIMEGALLARYAAGHGSLPANETERRSLASMLLVADSLDMKAENIDAMKAQRDEHVRALWEYASGMRAEGDDAGFRQIVVNVLRLNAMMERPNGSASTVEQSMRNALNPVLAEILAHGTLPGMAAYPATGAGRLPVYRQAVVSELLRILELIAERRTPTAGELLDSAAQPAVECFKDIFAAG